MKTRLFLLFAFFLLLTGRSFSQSVGINTTATQPDSSAILDVSSTIKGVLIPRLTSAERLAINNPANSLTVYDRSTGTFWYYIDGTGWTEIALKNDNLWQHTGVNIYNKNLTPVSIGNYASTNTDGLLNLVKRSSNTNGIDTFLTFYRSAIGGPDEGMATRISFFNELDDQHFTEAASITATGENITAGEDHHSLTLRVTEATNPGSQLKLDVNGVTAGTATKRRPLKIFANGNSYSGGLEISDNTPASMGPSLYFNTANHNWAMYATNNNPLIGSHKLIIRNVTKQKDIMMFDSSGRVSVDEYGNLLLSAKFSVNNDFPAVANTAIYGRQHGGADITPGFSIGVWGDNYNGAGVAGTSDSSIGTYGFSAKNYGLYGFSASNNGFAGVYGTNPGNTNGAGVMGEIPGGINNRAVYGKSTGLSGKAAFFENTNTAGNDTAFIVKNAGTGTGGFFHSVNTGSQFPVVDIRSEGAATGLKAVVLNPSNNFNARAIYAYGTGNATGIYTQSDEGTALSAGTSSATSSAPAFILNSATNGKGAYMSFFNSNGAGEGLHILKFGPGTGLLVEEKKGKAAEFKITDTTNNNTAIEINNVGTGRAADFSSTNTNTVLPVARFTQSGKGGAIRVIDLSQTSNNPAAFISSQSLKAVEAYADSVAVEGTSLSLTGGVGLKGVAIGTNGIGVKGETTSNNDSFGSVTGINNGTGPGIYGKSTATTGTRSGIIGEVSGASGISYGVQGITKGGSGAAVYGLSDYTSTGIAGLFQLLNLTSTATALSVGTQGLGKTLHVYNINDISTSSAFVLEDAGLSRAMEVIGTNASSPLLMSFVKTGTGDFALYEDNLGANKIRFDHTGKGFFNGGTQNSGADIAEAFDVTGNKHEYEPGDVLVISVDKDRTVEKSAQPYSTLVAGVYATKPGVLLTEENIETDLSGKVPMGVVGVIPTKVCMEGGEIIRGDLLVTSSLPGVAMKADMEKIKPGQVIGKALENFNSSASGRINVLVNVK